MKWHRLLSLAVVFGGCRARAPLTPSGGAPGPAPEASPEAPVVHRGVVRNGVYQTNGPGFEIPIPGGWTWTEGPAGAALQLQVRDEATGLALEIWRFSGSDDSLRPRDGCPWTFEDRGTYTGPGGLQLRTVATCVPVDAVNARVFAWMVRAPEAAWQLEGHVPPGLLIEGDSALRWLVDRFALTP